MKVKLGYYDSIGTPISDPPECDKYILMMGELRKKISEHEHQSPYKFNRVDKYTKTYCDENRIYIYAIFFQDGKLVKTVKTATGYYYGRSEEYELLKKICSHIRDNKIVNVRLKYNIPEGRAYYPVYIGRAYYPVYI